MFYRHKSSTFFCGVNIIQSFEKRGIHSLWKMPIATRKQRENPIFLKRIFKHTFKMLIKRHLSSNCKIKNTAGSYFDGGALVSRFFLRFQGMKNCLYKAVFLLYCLFRNQVKYRDFSSLCYYYNPGKHNHDRGKIFDYDVV